MNRRLLLITFLLACGQSHLLNGQVNTSAIAGIVTDESGSVAPKVEITVVQEGTGLTRKTTTNETGEYVLPQLPPGRYELSARAPGFQKTVIRDLMLAIAQRERIDIALKVGQVAEEVTVSAQAAQLIEPDTASLGQLIERRTIQDLPLNGRNYLTLGALSPGVIPAIPPAQNSASFIGATAQRPDRSILVGGQRESSTSYLLDGVELRNPRVGDTSMNPSLDAIQEFKIQRNFFQAEFGNSPAIINVATKSGTNEWHGSAYELLRNNKMDARNFFSAVPEPFKRNQFGGSVGAPILKDKLFVFGSYEGFRQRLGSVQRGLFPTQTLLGGDFTGQNLIYDPLSFDAAAGTRQAFAGNVIPASRINAISKKFLPYIPVTDNPTVQGANLVGTPVQKLTDDQESIRADWLINSKHSLLARQAWQSAPLDPAALVPYGGRQVISRAYNEMAQLTSTLTPTIINVARIYHSYANLFSQQVTVPSNIGAEIGITGISTIQRNWGVPAVSWAGFSSIGSDGLTQGGILNSYNITDSMAIVRGRHSIKFGFDVRQTRIFLDSDNSIRGSFTFASSYSAALNTQGNPAAGTGHPVADFLLGYPTNMIGALGTSQTHFRFYTDNFYAQDDWKITPELTINYGLRYEYISPPTAQELDHVYGFDFNTGKQLFPVLKQIRPSIIEPDHKDFSPRLGLAYNPRWAPTWVARAGAGVYYDQTQGNEVQFITNSPPTFFQQNINVTGRGLPTYQFGVNTLPIVPLPPISPEYQIPPGTAFFAAEINGRKPRAYMYEAAIQKSIFNNWLAEVAYAGSQGKRLSKRYNADPPATPGILYRVTPNAVPYPNLGSILYSSQAGKSSFHALNLKLERRFAMGFSLLTSYSWSHSIDTDSAGSYGTPNLNPANFQLDNGSSDFDIRQRFVASFLYELPFGRGKRLLSGGNGAVNQFVGGWQLNTITVFQSGVNRSVTSPNTSTVARITQRADATGVDSGSDFTRNGPTIHPGRDFGSTNRSLYWFNPNAFASPAPLTFGTSGRDLISGPGFWNWDVSLFKNFHLTERKVLQFRAEFFDAFNQVRFDPPQMDTSSAFFGQIQSAEPPRILQMGLRFQF